MGRKTVARRRFLAKTVDPLTPSPTPTPPPSPPRPFASPSPPPPPSPPSSPPPPPPQPTPPPSSPKPPTFTKGRFKTFATKSPATKPFVRKPTTRSATHSVPKSDPPPSPRRSQHSVPSSSAATPSSTSQPRKRKTAGTTGKPRSESLKLVKVLSGRVYEDDWISRAEFKVLKESLENQGWLKLLNYNDAVYEDEVRQFYSNLVISESLVLSSTVNDVMITHSVQELGQLLEVPSAGFSELPHQTWPYVLGVDNATISRTLSDQPLPQAQIFSSALLSGPHKLLRNLVTKSILPRVENRGECLIMDQVLLLLLVHGNPISLPHLMFHHMRNLSISSLYFPYGLWLTKVFQAFDVLTPTSKGVACVDFMCDSILSRMDLCVLKGELLKKDFRGFTPKEACAGCLKMMEYMRDMQKQMQQLLARQRASDTLAAQRHRQLMSKP